MHAHVAGHTDSGLPNGLAMNGVSLNGHLQHDSDSDSDDDEFGQEPEAPDSTANLAATVSLEHSHKQASGQSLLTTIPHKHLTEISHEPFSWSAS